MTKELDKITMPFQQQQEVTYIPDYLFDEVLPKVSSPAWKILILMYRQTDGYNPEDFTYSEIKLRTGISSNSTVTRALRELKKFNNKRSL